MISALAEMAISWKPTEERAQFIEEAIRIVNSTIETLTIDGILTEIQCENKTETWCNNDQRMYKGIFIRSLRYLIDSME
jgi:hypothetical protein